MPIMAAWRRWGWEGVLALVAGAAFLGFLGSTELWGKREQRASAEALDTVDHQRWLVAEIQGRPRLEKPPLPRWVTAGLMIVTARRDEAIVRWPNALAGLAMVGLIYGLGRSIGGRSVGLAAGFALASSFFFLVEMRHAGNDGFLALFTTLALLAAWRRLNGLELTTNLGRSPLECESLLSLCSPELAPGPFDAHPSLGSGLRSKLRETKREQALALQMRGRPRASKQPATTTAPHQSQQPGPRKWSLLFYASLGLGFLTKGPIILLLVGLPVVGTLATSRRLRAGLRMLADGWGLAIFVALALAWPVPVLVRDPAAARVWWLEMAQKTGTLDMPHDKVRESVALDWFWMTLPWTPLALMGAFGPLRKSFRIEQPGLAFAWWWAIGNLGILALWKVAKPSYYLPCLPGVAILVGSEWVRVCRLARDPSSRSLLARGALQAFWVALFAGSALAPVVVRELDPADLAWAIVGASSLAVAVVAAAWAWRRGGDAGAMIPLATGFVAVALIGYGAIAPGDNPARGHRELARRLDALVPAQSPTVWFFNDLDEGLWFYLQRHKLSPISAAKFNRGFDLRVDATDHKIDTPERRVEQAREQLSDWARHADPGSPFVLIRAKIYDRFAADVADFVEPVFRETDVKRNEILLLRVRSTPAMASKRPENPGR